MQCLNAPHSARSIISSRQRNTETLWNCLNGWKVWTVFDFLRVHYIWMPKKDYRFLTLLYNDLFATVVTKHSKQTTLIGTESRHWRLTNATTKTSNILFFAAQNMNENVAVLQIGWKAYHFLLQHQPIQNEFSLFAGSDQPNWKNFSFQMKLIGPCRIGCMDI